MGKIKIGESLRNGFRILVENPILVVLGVVTNLPLILVEPKVSKNMFWFIAWFLLTPYFIGLTVKFIYESREKKPLWAELSKFVLSKYILLLVTYIVYCVSVFIGMVIIIIPGIFLLVKLIMCDCGIILENDGVIDSLKRSWRITKGNWWRLFVLLLVTYSPIIIFSIFESLFPKVVYALFSLLLTACIFAWSQCTFTLTYLKLREQVK